MRLTDQNGRTVPVPLLYAAKDRVRLNVMGLDAGVYFVETYTTNKMYETKIIIVK